MAENGKCSEISGSQGSECEDYRLLGCSAVRYRRNIPTLHMGVLNPSSP
jgi:hypothetical protein